MRQRREHEPLDYNVNHVSVVTCGQLYGKWKETKALYKLAAPEGLALTIEYADTLNMLDVNGEAIGPDAPTVLCLHGAPGSHHDYAHLIKHLGELGMRVIAPNFPSKLPCQMPFLFNSAALFLV